MKPKEIIDYDSNSDRKSELDYSSGIESDNDLDLLVE